MRADPQVRRRNEDLTQEEQQPREERHHGGDEEQGHGHRRVEARERSQEQRRDHRADEHCRDGAERDGAADQLGAAGERRELGANARRRVRRERRLVSTASIAPIPERRNTGATASWIAWATPVMPGDCCTRGLTEAYVARGYGLSAARASSSDPAK